MTWVLFHALDFNGEEQPLCELTPLDIDVLIGRLYELENKIENGELCDRKETAKEIVLRINQVRKTHLGHLRSELDMICRKYGIELEDEE